MQNLSYKLKYWKIQKLEKQPVGTSKTEQNVLQGMRLALLFGPEREKEFLSRESSASANE